MLIRKISNYLIKLSFFTLVALTAACGRDDEGDKEPNDPRCSVNSLQTSTNDQSLSSILGDFIDSIKDSGKYNFNLDEINRLASIEFVNYEEYTKYNKNDRSLAYNFRTTCTNGQYFYRINIIDPNQFVDDNNEFLKNKLEVFKNKYALRVMVYHEIMHIWYGHDDNDEPKSLMSPSLAYRKLTQTESERLIEQIFNTDYLNTLPKSH